MTPRPFQILLLSDDRFLLRRVSKFLEVFGYDVQQAAELPQALAAAAAKQPDFLIVDAALGGQNALQLCRAVRKQTSGNYTCCLLLVSDPDPSELTEALESGYDDFLGTPVVFGELLARLRAGARLIEFERRLVDQAFTDRTTNLPDRTALFSRLQQQEAESPSAQCQMAVFDLDFFHRVEACNGRATSKAVLQSVARWLQSAVGDHFLASLGGDRFAVAMAEMSPEPAADWCRSLLGRLAEHEFSHDDQSFQLTASCGLTDASSAESPESVLQKALSALRLAKASGRNGLATSDEVESEAAAWTEIAVAGRMFETTAARDVMTPCALLISADEALPAAQALLQHSRLDAAAVVDRDGAFVGVITDEDADACESSHKSRSAAQRTVRQAMATDVPTFAETTSLAELMDFFTAGEHALAVVVRQGRPLGIVHCHGLAALNDRLTADHFLPTVPVSTTSEYLLVPDLCLTETS